MTHFALRFLYTHGLMSSNLNMQICNMYSKEVTRESPLIVIRVWRSSKCVTEKMLMMTWTLSCSWDTNWLVVSHRWLCYLSIWCSIDRASSLSWRHHDRRDIQVVYHLKNDTTLKGRDTQREGIWVCSVVISQVILNGDMHAQLHASWEDK